MYRVAILAGSSRRGSVNRQLAEALKKLAAASLDLQLIPIDGLPMYNDDLWEDPPAEVMHFKQEIEAHDAVLFVTPEYNRSLPPLLKNAIDWGTRPYGQNVWGGKPTSIIGISVGATGTAAVQAHLRSIMVILNAPVMGQPEVYLTSRPGLFDSDNEITDPDLRQFLLGYLGAFEAWITRLLPLEARA